MLRLHAIYLSILVALPNCTIPPDPPTDGVLLIGIEPIPPQPGSQIALLDKLTAQVVRIDVVHRIDKTDASSERVITVQNEPATATVDRLQHRYPRELARLLVPQGYVYQIRFVTDTITITLGTDTQSVKLPSGPQTGLKVNPADGVPFQIRPGEFSGVLITFDAAQQLHHNKGQGWMLKPTIEGESVPAGRLSPFVQDRVVIMFKSGVTTAQIADLNAAHNITILRSLLVPRAYLLKLPTSLDIGAALRAYGSSDLVEVALPSFPMPSPRTPGEPVQDDQRFVRLPQAWDFNMGNFGPLVAVVDTGVALDHPDLVQNLWINPGEIPPSVINQVGDRNNDGVVDYRDLDVDRDGVITFADLNDPAIASACPASLNPNSPKNICDPLDLVNGDCPNGNCKPGYGWQDGIDNDGNGIKDDIVGWDMEANDNMPSDVNGHGTAVAGIIGAAGDNVVGGINTRVNEFGGIAGTNWRVRILPVKRALMFEEVMDAAYYATMFNADIVLVEAANVIVKNARGPLIGCEGIPVGDDEFDLFVNKLRLYWNNVLGFGRGLPSLAVAPAGNCPKNADSTDVFAFPGEMHGPATISVTQVTFDNPTNPQQVNVAFGVAFGENSVDIGAPGAAKFLQRDGTTSSGDSEFGGTSGASAYVAGAAALVLAANPALKGQPCHLRNRLTLNAAAFPTNLAGAVSGARALDVDAAVLNARAGPAEVPGCP